jgi:hypothetical protein
MSFSKNNVQSYDDLKEFLGISRLDFWSCPSCGPSVLTSSVATSPHYSWGVVLVCGLCNSSWLGCRECKNVRSHFLNAADSLGHHCRKHCVIVRNNATSLTVHDPFSLPYGTSVHQLVTTSGSLPSMESVGCKVSYSPSKQQQCSLSHVHHSPTKDADALLESRVEVLSHLGASVIESPFKADPAKKKIINPMERLER